MEKQLNTGVYTKTTQQVKVSVIPTYLHEHSDPADNHYVWAYTVQVENLSNRMIQLLSRHWVITDAAGSVHEVKGEGVVGEQPKLNAGEGFRYTSGTSLKTPSGIMAGHYYLVDEHGERFPIEVPAFSLDSPFQRIVPN